MVWENMVPIGGQGFRKALGGCGIKLLLLA
jgi:hypothetical protein